MEKRIKVLHLLVDDKFIDGHRKIWESLDCVFNEYLLVVADKERYKFKYIKNISGIVLCDNCSDFLSFLDIVAYDIVYVYSLNSRLYKYIRIIPHNIKVICWTWGYDIYYGYGAVKPLIKLDLYKAETYNYIKKTRNKNYWLKQMYRYTRFFYDCLYKYSAVKRLDYISPVIPLEYVYLKKNPIVKAGLFWGIFCKHYYSGDFSYFNEKRNLLIGNSANKTNNHLDIIKKIKDYNIINNKIMQVIFPLNYGDTKYSSFIKQCLTENDGDFNVLDKFIPYSEYCDLVSSCSHAIFGVIRQQAMGNISLCLRSGVKIFLYKDSIVYEYLKNEGYIIYTIDDDLTENSLNISLTKEEAKHNYDLYISKVPYENYPKDFLLSELKRILN